MAAPDPPKERSARELLKLAIMQELDNSDNKFEEFVNAYPAVCEVKDDQGLYLIHHAIIRKVSMEKINHIVSAKENVVKQRYKGELPLSMILDEQPSGKEVEIMIRMLNIHRKAASELDDQGAVQGMPLHKLLQKTPFNAAFGTLLTKLLDVYPQAAAVKVGGNLALHFALDGHKPAWIAKRILDIFPGAASVPDSSGRLPLHIAVISNIIDGSTIKRILEAYPGALLEPVNIRGHTKTIFEFAVRNRLKQESVDILLKGGSGENRKAVAYARAAVARLENRNWKQGTVEETDKEERAQENKATRLGESRLHFYIKVLGMAAEERRVPTNYHCIDLKMLIEEETGVPCDVQKILVDNRRIGDQERLAHVVADSARRQSDIQRQDSLATEAGGEASHHCTVEVHLQNLTLHLALRNGMGDELLKGLVKMRPSLTEELDPRGMLPLHVALNVDTITPDSKTTIVKELLKRYPEAKRKRSCSLVGEYPLQTAIVSNCKEELIDELMKDVTADDWDDQGFFRPAGADDRDVSDVPLLYTAIMTGCSAKLVESLLVSRCPIHVRNASDGHSPLEYTLIYNSSAAVFHNVLDATCSHNFGFFQEKGPSGQTLMHVACQHGALASRIKVLCDYGEHILSIRDHDQRLPLHVAVSSGMSFDAVRELVIRHPEAIYERDGRGRNPLHLAVMSAPADGVVFELARSYHTIEKVRNDRGQSLLHMAVLADAPVHVLHELLDAAPDLIADVSLVDGKWPHNNAGREVRRLALLPRKPSRLPKDAEALDNEAPNSRAGQADRGGNGKEDSEAKTEEPDEGWGKWLLGPNW